MKSLFFFLVSSMLLFPIDAAKKTPSKATISKPDARFNSAQCSLNYPDNFVGCLMCSELSAIAKQKEFSSNNNHNGRFLRANQSSPVSNTSSRPRTNNRLRTAPSPAVQETKPDTLFTVPPPPFSPPLVAPPLTNITHPIPPIVTHISPKEAFDKVYASETWGTQGGGSGTGSDPDYARITSYIMRIVVFKYNILSLLDAPCGGVSESWMKSTVVNLLSDIPCFRYHGVDVVTSVIEKNILKMTELQPVWVKEKRIEFTVVDVSASSTQLPTGFDLILSRDALQHLSETAIAGVLNNYCQSGAKYLLVGSYIKGKEDQNRKIVNGDCFPINLLRTPYNFPSPIEIYMETAVEVDQKYLLLYKLNDLCMAQGLVEFVKSNNK